MSGFSPYMPLLLMLLALVLDIAQGWPAPLFRAIGHPVTWFGHWISFAEKRLNTGSDSRRFAMGLMTSMSLLLLVAVVAAALQSYLLTLPGGVILVAILAWPFLAVKSMYQHVAAVLVPLQSGDVDGARQAVSMIVGRDVSQLDEGGISRAALESLAENTGDGVIAPLFWGLVAGLPGIAVYKAINTLDSMIGHHNNQYEYFGKFAARLDDVVNWLPARLTGYLFAIASFKPHAWRIMWLDATRHRSPNAGWPESAMAGALDVRLSGPRQYGDKTEFEPWINQTGYDADRQVVRRGLRLYRHMILLVLALMIGVMLVGELV